ncbi:hypothetical protein NFHSH190041_19900 [Shewanella sp. NFH-SH190041]|uniref:hypothetical protein n=1 Tax=Shewanella sp. NFH-SH190041 TaxID=2950245 RepID=UPI0021C2CD39|nr:hypothetical protein [Shewanella sp. NFH-SH190041]BDM64538.1 hypothetical protein NFHSH190041_19900 [Shewanella sp. NFH-SH190041]
MKDLKSRLLSAKKRTPVKVHVFGDDFEAVCSPAAKIAEYNKQVENADSDEILDLAAQFVLDSLLEEDGSVAAASVTPQELKDVYSYAEIFAAFQTITAINTDVDAAKNA